MMNGDFTRRIIHVLPCYFPICSGNVAAGGLVSPWDSVQVIEFDIQIMNVVGLYASIFFNGERFFLELGQRDIKGLKWRYLQSFHGDFAKNFRG